MLKEYVPPPPRTQADRAKLLYPGLMILKICGKNLPSPLDLASVNHLIQSAEPPYSLTVRDVDLYEELLQVA